MKTVLLIIGSLFILKLIFRIYTPRIRGYFGERRIAKQLNRLNSEEYRVFNKVLVRTNRGSSQIDHVVVSVYGIFVIETKNYGGKIYGGEDSEEWIQAFYTTKNNFRNPIKQNWSHVYALKEILGDYGGIYYHPIVVFTGRAELRNLESAMPVIYDGQLLNLIMYKSGAPNLSLNQVEAISDRLGGANLHNKKANDGHVRQVRAQVSERKQKERMLICPKCGGKLILRNGKYGQFYGCANYPKCKYIFKNDN